MSEPPSAPQPSKRKSTPAFLRGFNIEDLILYVFSLLVLGLFGWLFFQHYVTTVKPESDNSLVATAWLAPSEDDICLSFLKAQMANTALRYNQARIATATNAVRRSLVFLIGTIGFLLGCIIIIRGVRDASFDADIAMENKARFRLITSSPGIVIVVLSTILIMGVVFLDDRVQVSDGQMGLPETCFAAPTARPVSTPIPTPIQTPPTPAKATATVPPQFWTPTPPK